MTGEQPDEGQIAGRGRCPRCQHADVPLVAIPIETSRGPGSSQHACVPCVHKESSPFAQLPACDTAGGQ